MAHQLPDRGQAADGTAAAIVGLTGYPGPRGRRWGRTCRIAAGGCQYRSVDTPDLNT
jgi:hypothetical protein